MTRDDTKGLIRKIMNLYPQVAGDLRIQRSSIFA